MTPEEERVELERELAAELAALGDEEADEMGRTEEREPRYQHQRLNLEAVLASGHGPGESCGVGGTWACLLESVAFCEAQVFDVFRVELDELKTQLLPQLAAAVQSVVADRGLSVLHEDSVSIGPAVAALHTESVPTSAHTETPSKSNKPHDNDGAIAKPRAGHDERIPGQAFCGLKGTFSTAAIASERCEPTEAHPVASPLERSPSTKLDPASLSTHQLSADQYHQEHAPPLDLTRYNAVQQLHGVTETESRRRRVQLIAHHAKAELTAWLTAKQLELEREQSAREFLQTELARERDARIAMANEERWRRALMDHERRVWESQLMQWDDERSRQAEAAFARASQQQRYEQQLMAREEARAWRCVRHKRESEQREKLVEEQGRLRRLHHRVLTEVVTTLARRADAQRKREELERRRESREESMMRSEELCARRMLVHERMVRADCLRQGERRAMEMEDALGDILRDAERVVREKMWMENEETRSRVWETLWRLRIKHLKKWITGDEKRRVRQSWSEWRGVVDETRQRHAAACIIQSQVREWMATHRRIDHETALAARVVQSAFRGFHVRRKYQNALDMAHRMTRHVDDGEFDEVNLDDWICAPPELDDDWEKPILPRPGDLQGSEDEPVVQSDGEQDKEEENNVEDAEEEEIVRQEAVVHVSQRIDRPVQVVPPAEAGVQPNLAAVLWNKMRKRTQRQKHAADERQRQQDPVYRVQKLLSKAAPPSHATHSTSTNQHESSVVSTSITWGTNLDKKKTPTVKLPSLVERLRKRTAAAR